MASQALLAAITGNDGSAPSLMHDPRFDHSTVVFNGDPALPGIARKYIESDRDLSYTVSQSRTSTPAKSQ